MTHLILTGDEWFASCCMICILLVLKSVRPVQCVVVSTPVLSFFFRTFQVAVLDMANVCAMV